MSNGVDRRVWDNDKLSEHAKLDILYTEITKINRKLSWKTGAVIVGISVVLSVIICSQDSPVKIITDVLAAMK